jgi:hypothetical protein
MWVNPNVKWMFSMKKASAGKASSGWLHLDGFIGMASSMLDCSKMVAKNDGNSSSESQNHPSDLGEPINTRCAAKAVEQIAIRKNVGPSAGEQRVHHDT